MGGDPRRLLMEPCISIACLDSPSGRGWGEIRGTAGIRGWCGWREVGGSMDSRRVAVLLLLLLPLLDWGHTAGPESQDQEAQGFMVSKCLVRASPFSCTSVGTGALGLDALFPKVSLGLTSKGNGPSAPEASPFSCDSLSTFPHCQPLAIGRQWTPPTATCPDLCVPLTLPASSHGEIWPESSLPVSAPKVWQKCPGALEQ
ncbi:pro-FMRFamide-related neuropeptide FF isoform X1 [Dipodomys spectabilis]|uniref:pro-FMRFamide-related neuropeptide FF isoform X1 n=1 Tax=Dipodomys spectabilis TaxID=105255 RepID=UPI001C547AA8|nr:pro-FMRFamide-related neuropeptide FF isoform X1 [Dipodomys spectabilis]